MKRPSSSLPYSALRVRAEAADAAPVKTKNFSIFLPTHCCVLAASALTRLRISAASANGLISTILSAAMSGRPGTHLSCSSSVATGASFTATQPCCKTMTVCKKAIPIPSCAPPPSSSTLLHQLPNPLPRCRISNVLTFSGYHNGSMGVHCTWTNIHRATMGRLTCKSICGFHTNLTRICKYQTLG